MSPVSKARTCPRTPKLASNFESKTALFSLDVRRWAFGVSLTLRRGRDPNLSKQVRGRDAAEQRRFQRANVRR